ncbi:MAG: glutathione peroxidase [Planctomycetaceae bacterium]
MADDAKETKDAKAPTSVHDFKVKSLDGEEVDLEKYKGKVLLVVNVASQCGATPQYSQLQALHEKYADQGLVVMGFPCNQFGAQEPGDAKEIQEFCSTKYAVKFPMFAKINVNGDEQAPIYDFLKNNADDHSNIGWNFEKFIVGKDGKVAARFKTRTKPDAPEVVKLLEEELAK